MNALVTDPFGEAPLFEPVKPILFPIRRGDPIKVTLPYPPSANRYWRTRVIVPKHTRKPVVQTYVGEEAAAFKENVGWLLKSVGIRKVLDCKRVQVDIELWPHQPLDWAKRARKDPLYWADSVQRLDLDNARKVVYDSLKGIAIEDDFQIWKDSGEVMEPDGRDQCVVVTITPLTKYDPQASLQL